MADIVFRYVEMRQAAADIKALAARYKSAATTFESDFLGSISGSVMEYTRDTIPQLLEALSDLLSANADQMESADRQIAENIPS